MGVMGSAGMARSTPAAEAEGLTLFSICAAGIPKQLGLVTTPAGMKLRFSWFQPSRPTASSKGSTPPCPRGAYPPPPPFLACKGAGLGSCPVWTKGSPCGWSAPQTMCRQPAAVLWALTSSHMLGMLFGAWNSLRSMVFKVLVFYFVLFFLCKYHSPPGVGCANSYRPN